MAFGLTWDDEDIVEVMESRGGNNAANYNVRLLEAETAMAFGKIFDGTWYEIPVEARQVMIASRLGRQWIESLSEERAYADAKRGK